MNPILIPSGPLRVNTWIVPLSEATCFVVDPAADEAWGDGGVILAKLRQLRLRPLAAVLTHGHFDHVAGLAAFCAEQQGIPVLIHAADADCIGAAGERTQAATLRRMGLGHIAPAFRNLPAATALLEDGHSLAEYVPAADSVSAGALSQWTVLHTPGHSRGSVCLYSAAERSLISGDTIFYQSWGRTDLPGGNEAQLQASLHRLYTELPGEVRVYPGHEEYGFTLAENH